MMNFYHMPKPKGFHHQFIYVDERKERIKKMEEKAKQELGMEPSAVKPEYNFDKTCQETSGEAEQDVPSGLWNLFVHHSVVSSPLVLFSEIR